MLSGLPPVIDGACQTLILGSFPGAASLAAGVYYAHPRNQFWPILARLTGEPLTELAFDERYRRVLAHRIGLWDVLGACERSGSLDADIRKPAANDFDRLRAIAPGVRRVLFNGRAAGRFQRQFLERGYHAMVLPSTSPAHAARNFDEKNLAWHEAFESPLPVQRAAIAAVGEHRT